MVLFADEGEMYRLIATLLISACLVAPLNAQGAGSSLAECLVSQTTGADRVGLARWIGFAIAAHPSISRSVAIPEEAVERTDMQIGHLLTVLLTDRCKDEALYAFRDGGNGAFESAFEALGRVAMSEVMMDNEVNSALTKFLDYVDSSVFEEFAR